MNPVYPEAVKLIKKKNNFALATIITRDGSTPRGPGSKMIIRKDGTICGTIGGGMLEAEVMRMAGDVIKNKKAYVAEFHLKNWDFNAMDMTCGGDLEVMIDYINAADKSNERIFEYINKEEDKKGRSFLVTYIPDKNSVPLKRNQFIILEEGILIGDPPEDINELNSLINNSSLPGYKIVNLNGKRFIIESINKSHCAYIFGAGHVGQKVAELLKFTGFHVSVFDDRPEFVNKERFPSADRIYKIQYFTDPIGHLEIDRHSYIIIVTRGHVNDENVLRLVLRTEAGYIGMIGSKRKKSIIYDNMLHDGFTEEELARVHAPIGLPIKAETPEEIAVSIVAEIIKARAEM